MTDLLELASRVCAQARPGEQVEAYVARGTTTTVRAYGGEVESLTSAASQGVGVRVVFDHRQGFAHCGSLDPVAVADTLAEARDNAAFGEPDDHVGVALPDGVPEPPLDLWVEELAAFPVASKVALALDLERAVLGLDDRVRSVRTAVYSDSAGESAVVTSTGVAGYGRGTGCHVSVVALADDGTETKVGVGIDVSRDPRSLDVASTATDAVERAVRLFGAAKPASGRLAVVLEPRVAAPVLGILGSTLSAERVQKGRSPFADRLGETIASPLLSMVDDATDARSLAADPFDGEGLSTRRTPLVTEGVLQGFLYDSTTARRDGTTSTASAVRGYRSTPGPGPLALAVTPGRGSLDELVADVDDGLLVTSLSGLHSGVNPVSGDLSVGVEGLRIRDGALAEPVREATIATTLQRMLLDVRSVGGDLEWTPGGVGAVTLVVGDVALSGR